MIFDGREYARKLGEELAVQFAGFASTSGRKRKLLTIVDPANESGMKYTQIKMRTAEKLGVDMQKWECTSFEEARSVIEEANRSSEVDGIMVQLPFPGSEELIDLIEVSKDVDGLTRGSPFVPATVLAVAAILEESGVKDEEVVVVGSQGEVGSRVIEHMRRLGRRTRGVSRKEFTPQVFAGARVVVSCVGHPGLITPEMVEEGIVAIDVGYPSGDFSPEVAHKAAFFTPVPGGVGPVTVMMLFQNLARV